MRRKPPADISTNYIGTEHLLAGLVHEEHGTAGMVLRDLGVSEEKLMELIDRFIAPSGEVMTISVQGYTPRAERLLAESVQEAENFHSTRVGTEHLLLAMLRMGDCVGTRLLHTMGMNIQKIQKETLTAMGEESSQGREDGGKKADGRERSAPRPCWISTAVILRSRQDRTSWIRWWAESRRSPA